MVVAVIVVVAVAIIGFFIYRSNGPLHSASEGGDAGKQVGRTMFQKFSGGKPLPPGLQH